MQDFFHHYESSFFPHLMQNFCTPGWRICVPHSLQNAGADSCSGVVSIGDAAAGSAGSSSTGAIGSPVGAAASSGTDVSPVGASSGISADGSSSDAVDVSASPVGVSDAADRGAGSSDTPATTGTGSCMGASTHSGAAAGISERISGSAAGFLVSDRIMEARISINTDANAAEHQQGC